MISIIKLLYFLMSSLLKGIYIFLKFVMYLLYSIIKIFKKIFMFLFYDYIYKMNELDQMDGLEFEQATKNILKYNGFKNIEITKSSGDYGIDILANKDQKSYAIQCKNYSGHVGVKAVHEATSGAIYYDCDKAVVLTNNYFTKSAMTIAESNNVELWDRDVLQQMCQKPLGMHHLKMMIGIISLIVFLIFMIMISQTHYSLEKNIIPLSVLILVSLLCLKDIFKKEKKY